MAKLPILAPAPRQRGASDDSVVLAVYAPFGTDATLSRYPNAAQVPVAQQALVRSLQQVAAEGANVCALIDLFEDDSWLVEIPAGQPKAISITSTWKQDMSAPQALAGFLRRTRQCFPTSTLVLALEGHGGGFVPDIDAARLTPSSVTRWSRGGSSGQVRWVKSESQTRFEPDTGSPALPMSSPELPMSSPELPATRLPLSTWALGAALASALKSGVPRPAVIHFNNCFNASLELLHTVAPYADCATGYANYDFFTAGSAYPTVFRKLRLAGSATRLQLAQWFALQNQAELAQQPGHPTLGAAVPLAAMRKQVSIALDAFALALTRALRPAVALNRPPILARIRQAAIDAQHYDTEPGFELKVPDQFVDIASFAAQVRKQFATDPVLSAAATALQAALAGLFVYGDKGSPAMAQNPAVIYDFQNKQLGLNIFFPDPALDGIWDWRSPYYLSGVVDPTKAPAQRHVIDFLAEVGGQRPRWVEFIVEYHRDIKFVGFFPARAPFFPLFNAKYSAPPSPTGPGQPPGDKR